MTTDSTVTQADADTHEPPMGYEQVCSVPTHGDFIQEGVEAERITKTDFPATIFAMNIIRMDSGGPSWPAEAKPFVPLCWHPMLPVIETALNRLDNGDRSKVDLDNEMYTFCCGEESDMRAIRERSQALEMAGIFLNDFFESWSYIAPKARLTQAPKQDGAGELLEALKLAHELLTCDEIQGLARKARVKGFVPDVRKIEATLSNFTPSEQEDMS